MISSREEEGNGDLCLIQFRPTAAPLSSVLYFTSHGDSELTDLKKKILKNISTSELIFREQTR